MHEEGKDHSRQHADSDDKLHLLHEGKHSLLRFAHGMSRLLPSLDAAFQITDVGKTQCMKFLHGLPPAFAAAAHHDKRFARRNLVDPLFKLAQWDQSSPGDVFFSVFDRFSDIHETTFPPVEPGLEIMWRDRRV